MLFIVSVVCGLSFAMAVSSNPDTHSNLGQVVFSHILFRHGDRMPLEFYPTDPYQDASNWPNKIAQLTDVGRVQEFELGRWLRLRYNDLVSDRYDPDEIFIQSSDVDRTLMSAQCAMAGLYHPTMRESWHPALTWQSVPVHTVPVQADYLLGASSTYPCPAFKAELERASKLPEVQALQEKFADLYDYVSNHTGREVRDFPNALKVYDELALEEQHNIPLPNWARSIYPEPIKEAGLYSFVLPTWTPLLQRLKIGSLLKEMAEHFRAKSAGTLSPNRRLWVYSAHDATISAFLNTFKAFEIHFPPYASCVLLELRLIDQDYFVTLFYRNSTVSEPLLLTMKSCSAVCPLEQFLTLIQPLLPEDWHQECQLSTSVSIRNLWPAMVGSAAVISYIIICILTVRCLRRKSSKNYFTMPSSVSHDSKDSLV
ncbi:prostatic acid phosphatase-like [Homalodisca vitripennis]|uniref:prostatic acid phosphatase-like n=1 Tax=Homalodisca vitripennis TaxID=197043 RepID=UPI001EEC5681|nr:prostatic acid phosphatase-like [Homalodisca vitripennis]